MANNANGDEETTGTTIRKLVIAGGGTAGWMAATFLSQCLDLKRTSITLIESPEIGTVGVGEATIPPIQFFNKTAGINEADFMRATQGTFKLGIEFVDWWRKGERYMHPFGQPGKAINGVSFHAYWQRARAKGFDAPLWDYWMSLVAAYQGRFDWPSPDPRMPSNGLNYAYHFDAGLYAQYLRKLSEGRGVTRIEGTIEDVALDAHDGTITELKLKDGRVIEGDYFIDCTGFRALLIEQALGQGYDDWSNFLPANRAVAVPSARVSDPLPYTRATAREAGWQWRINLQHRTGNGYVYVSDHISDQAATDTLLQNLEGKPLADPRLLRFITGKRHASRAKNCVAIGLSSGFLEPLESTSIHFIQHAVIKFAASFPLAKIDPASDRLYNRIMDEELIQVRDFLVLHYTKNERFGEPLWDYVRNMPLPDSLEEKLELFQARGLAIFPNQTVFQEPNWLAVMLGQGVEPKGYDPLADNVPEAEMLAGLKSIRAAYATAAAAMPTHDQVLRRYCDAGEVVA